MILADINEILDWPVGLEGWHIDPKTGASAKIGNHCHGKNIEIESCFRVGNYFHVGDNFKVGISFHADNIFHAGDNFQAGSYFRSGRDFVVGDCFTAGDNFYAGDHFQAGHDFKAGENFKVSNYFHVDDSFNVRDHFVAGSRFRAGKCFRAGYIFEAGNFFRAGHDFVTRNRFSVGHAFKVGDQFRSGDNFVANDYFNAGDFFRAGDNFNSLEVAESVRAVFRAMGKKIKMVKWVKRMADGSYVSPMFDGGTRLTYELGKRIRVYGVECSDRQCAWGLHVMMPGVRPEWLGYDNSGHDLVALLVEVQTKDILFAGWPGCYEKMRVSSLVPIREL